MQSGEWLRPVIGPRNGTSAQCSRGERELPDGGLRYRERFADGARQRRIGIVAVARKLSIALGRYLETGAPPEGAVRKPNAHSVLDPLVRRAALAGLPVLLDGYCRVVT